MKYNKLTCLFGFHDYSKKPTTNNKCGYTVYLCKVCKKRGYWKWDNGDETWYTFDEKGDLVHEKWSDGCEYWKANSGHWMDRKPINWKYEKQI